MGLPAVFLAGFSKAVSSSLLLNKRCQAPIVFFLLQKVGPARSPCSEEKGAVGFGKGKQPFKYHLKLSAKFKPKHTQKDRLPQAPKK
ncbi:MAG: hypothetical protein A3G87_09295 [Omnitrophica bacterium RIFCSPLOWO2_12_FULL_50_11]|nr:MAG: hypothetical protein A3G87_09295 [Omnitrophica bacterium RIFCSPLOWO2_12_FULL_50_11]